MFQICVGLAQYDDGVIHSTWLLLDTCSTSSVDKNPNMLNNIRECLEQERHTVVTNGGNKSFNEIGEYELFPIEAHFNLYSMDNIVVLKDMDDVPVFRIKIIAQRSVQLQQSTKETFTISRSGSTGFTIMTLRLTTLYLVQPINLIPHLILICF